MIEFVLLFLIAGYAYWLGRQVLHRLGYEFATWAGSLSASTGLGLGLVAYLMLGLGLLGRLNLLAVTLAGVSVFAMLVIARLGFPVGSDAFANGVQSRANSGFDARPFADSGRATPRIHLATLFHISLLSIACLGTLLSALAPPTAGDALCYHLEIPKRFLQLGEIRHLPLTDNSVMPFLMELLYTLGLLLRGPELAQLVHWLVGILLALAVVELAAPIVGRVAGGWAATTALLVPGFTNQMTAPLNDLAVALYTTLMLVAWTHWSASNKPRWLALAGVFGGLALSVKLVAAAMVLVVAVAVAVAHWRRRGLTAACRAGATFGLCLLLFGGIWYARSWYHTGNPVYPYFNAWFGGEAHTPSILRTEHSLLEVPWAATMHPEEFGGRGTQFGAVFLAVLPGLVLIPRNREVRQLLLPALGYGLLWFTFRQDLRFLLPVVPILAIAAVRVVQELREVHRPAFVVATGCLAGLLTFQAVIVVNRARPCVAVALGRESREAYLERHEPSFAVARFVNTQLPPDSRLISQDYRGLYFQPDFVREGALRRRIPYRQEGQELVEYLATSGFTHVLLVQSHNSETAVYDQGFTERLGSTVGSLPMVFATRFAGPNGDRREYRLFELPRAGFRVQGSGFRIDAN